MRTGYPGQVHDARQHQAVALVIGRRTVLAMEVSRIDGTVGEGNLVVVGVIERLGEGVGGVEGEMARERMIDGQKERVVVGVDARLQVLDRVRTANHRVEHGANRHADDEVGAEVVNTIGAKHPVSSELGLEAEVELLHHRVLHFVVDDVDAAGTGAGNDEAGEGIAEGGRAGNEVSGGIEVDRNAGGGIADDVAGVDVDGE